MENEAKEARKARLSPEATILLTIGATALSVIIYRILYFIISGK